MKVNELSIDTIREYLRADDDVISDAELQTYLDASISYVKNYAGMDDAYMNRFDDISIAVLSVLSDFFDNRNMQVGISQSYENRTLKALLGMHSSNLLPKE